MATKKPAPRKRAPARRASQDNQDQNQGGQDEGQRDNNRSNNGNDKTAFVNITKLFETKKNPDNLVGTCKIEYLDALADLIAEAKDKNLGVSFFVFLQGKWGPSLAATVARPQEDRGSFNDGGRGQDRGQRSSNRGSYNRSGGNGNSDQNRRW